MALCYAVHTTEYKYFCGHRESHNCLYCLIQLIAIKNVLVPFDLDASMLVTVLVKIGDKFLWLLYYINKPVLIYLER